MGKRFCIVASFLTLADAYLTLAVLDTTPWIIKGWIFLPLLVYWIMILWMVRTHDVRQLLLNSIMWITLCIGVPTFVFTIFWAVGSLLGLLWHPIRHAFFWTGSLISAAWFLVALYGSVFGWRRIVVKHTDIDIPDLPDNFEGYRIAHLTDFHIGVYDEAPKTVDTIVEKVNALQPDVVVFTGDLVNTSPHELKEFTDVLSGFKAPDGVISVLGNHDYGHYHRYKGNDSAEKALDRLVELQKKMGWRLLRNESVQITRGDESIAIVGVENCGERHFPNKADLQKALSGLPKDECKILLSHDPSHWRREVLPDTDIPLMLAGHTHAMQFRVAHFSPSKYTYREWGGLYRDGDRQLYVSTGIGGNIAFRFGIYPTIDLLTLHRAP